MFIALNPLTAVILGALLLDERLSLAMCLGGVLILWGIYQCNKPLASLEKSGFYRVRTNSFTLCRIWLRIQ